MCTLKGVCQYTLFYVGGVEIHEYNRSKQCRRCQRYSTDFNALNAMSKMSKMVFAAFTQCCIQSTVTHLTHVEDVKYYVLCIQGLPPLPGGKATVFEPSILGV